ncbi:hypothetical protein HDU96_003867 [Phlyctochytrium bullatum]|nr:hypothetical protein HDU96_003867 [Phlyctochytrium bullatum]
MWTRNTDRSVFSCVCCCSDDEGRTPLHVALQHFHPNATEILLDAAADPKRSGQPAIEEQEGPNESGGREVTGVLERVISMGWEDVDVNAVDDRGNSWIDLALAKGMKRWLQQHEDELIEAGVDITPPASAIAGLYPIYSGFVRIAVAGEAEPVASVPFAGMVGRWRDAPIWIRKSPIFANQWLFPNFPGLNRNVNNTFSTGVYSSALDFAPLPASGTTLNLTDGAAILHAAATNSRYIKIEIV